MKQVFVDNIEGTDVVFDTGTQKFTAEINDKTIKGQNLTYVAKRIRETVAINKNKKVYIRKNGPNGAVLAGELVRRIRTRYGGYKYRVKVEHGFEDVDPYHLYLSDASADVSAIDKQIAELHKKRKEVMDNFNKSTTFAGYLIGK